MPISKLTCGASTTNDMITSVNALIDSAGSVTVAMFGSISNATINAAIDSGYVVDLQGQSVYYTNPYTNTINFRNGCINDAYGPVFQDYGKSYGVLVKPDEFSWFANQIYIEADGSCTTDFDIYSEKPTTSVTYYVGYTAGSDSNDGLTFATAFRTIAKALAMSSGTPIKIILEAGNWDRTGGAWGSYTIDRDVVIEVLGGKSATIYGSNLTFSWAKTSARNYVYEITLANIVSGKAVADEFFTDELGDFYEYTSVASVAACDGLAGSYYYDSGTTTLYVHCLNSRAADNNIRVWRDTACVVQNGNFKFWTKNISFYGIQNVVARASTLGSQYQPTWYAINSKFKYSQVLGNQGGGGFRSEGGHSYLVNCEAARNRYDGFNYHKYDLSSTLINATENLEINCVGRHNGTNAAGNNQGSTTHDGCSAIRINCTYFENDGPGIEDVHFGTSSLNLSVYSYDTRKLTSPRTYNVGGSGLGPAKMWFVNCKSGGRKTFDLVSSNGGLAYSFGCNFRTYNGAAGNSVGWNPFV